MLSLFRSKATRHEKAGKKFNASPWHWPRAEKIGDAASRRRYKIRGGAQELSRALATVSLLETECLIIHYWIYIGLLE